MLLEMGRLSRFNQSATGVTLRVPMPNWMPKTTNRWRADKAVLGTASAQILQMENGSKSRAVSFAVCLCWHARITAGGRPFPPGITTMRRYYFDLRYGDEITSDEVGLELPSIE
jgi:hypothetical protein